MERLHAVVGPVATNVYVLADERSREAIAIDTAIPCLAWIAGALEERGWTLKLIVSTHGHWDHVGDNAAVADHTGAQIAVHPLDAHRLTDPQPEFPPPFEIPPSVPAVDLAEGGEIRFGALRLQVLHTPGHTEGSVCLVARDDGPAVQRRHAVPRRVGPGGPPGAATRSRWSRRSTACHRLERRPRRLPGPRAGHHDRRGAALARAEWARLGRLPM